jgi:hypothetical protein
MPGTVSVTEGAMLVVAFGVIVGEEGVEAAVCDGCDVRGVTITGPNACLLDDAGSGMEGRNDCTGEFGANVRFKAGRHTALRTRNISVLSNAVVDLQEICRIYKPKYRIEKYQVHQSRVAANISNTNDLCGGQLNDVCSSDALISKTLKK